MAFPSKILVPVDFGPSSVAALDRAAELARAVGAAVHILHVYPYARGLAELASARIATPIETRESAERELQGLVERCTRVMERPVEGAILDGDPAGVIIERAAAGKYDLIAMGTHGWVGRLRMLAGSVAEPVIRSVSCPVLVVRVPE
jgi:universal stress protein A